MPSIEAHVCLCLSGPARDDPISWEVAVASVTLAGSTQAEEDPGLHWVRTQVYTVGTALRQEEMGL